MSNRVFTPDRQEQGFRDQAHLDAFYAYFDHGKTCTECRPGKPAEIDASLHATRQDCEVARTLYGASL